MHSRVNYAVAGAVAFLISCAPFSVAEASATHNSAGITSGGLTLTQGKSQYFDHESGLMATAANSRLTVSDECTPVLYVAARGSGQYGPGSDGWPGGSSKNDPQGFGPELNEVYSNLTDDLKGVGITPDSVRYPATSVTVLPHLHGVSQYITGLSAGVAQVSDDLSEQAARCPNQEIIMAGYSQGAMVIHRVLHRLADTAAGQGILARTAAAILIGDGDQVEFDNEVRDGSALPFAMGIGQFFPLLSGSSKTKFSASLGARVIRVCNWGDIVCDYQNNLLSDSYGIKVHESYPDSKALSQAITQTVSDAKSLHYYGGTVAARGKVGASLAAAAVVIGGKTPFTVTADLDGSVPSWATLGVAANNTVTLAGTPTAPGRWAFSIKVQDAANHTVTIPVSIIVSR